MKVIKKKTYNLTALLGRMTITNQQLFDSRKKMGLKRTMKCFACGMSLSPVAPVILASGKDCGNVQICVACEDRMKADKGETYETDTIMASELVRKLNAAIEANGDMPVINSRTMPVPAGDPFSYVVYHKGDDHFELE